MFEATSGGQHVDRTVLFNDQNRQYVRKVVHRASFLAGETVFEATSGGR